MQKKRLWLRGNSSQNASETVFNFCKYTVVIFDCPVKGDDAITTDVINDTGIQICQFVKSILTVSSVIMLCHLASVFVKGYQVVH